MVFGLDSRVRPVRERLRLAGIPPDAREDTPRGIPESRSCPGAIASAITMAITGRITGKVDARYLIVTGVGLFFWAMWLHYHFTLEIGMHDLLLPMILRGVGLGLIFVPLTQVCRRPTCGRTQLAQGTGLFTTSLANWSGSFGIAVAAYAC